MAAFLLVVLPACSGTDPAPDTTSTTAASPTTIAPPTTTSPPSTTATPPPTTTTSTIPPTTTTSTTQPPDADGAPALNPVPNDETDLSEYARIYREHLAYQNWLGLNPTTDPEIIGLVFHPDGPWWERQLDGMGTLLAENEVRFDNIEATFVSPFPTSDPANIGAIVMLADFERTEFWIRDATTGEVRLEDSEPEQFDLIVELRRHDGRWLVWDQAPES